MFSWQSIDALPLFASSIEVTLEETEQQHHFILCLNNGGYQIEEILISRIIRFYKEQLDKVMYYEAQLEKWLYDSAGSTVEKSSILGLSKKINDIKLLNYSIINLATKLDTNKNTNKILTADKNILIDFIEKKLQDKN